MKFVLSNFIRCIDSYLPDIFLFAGKPKQREI